MNDVTSPVPISLSEDGGFADRRSVGGISRGQMSGGLVSGGLVSCGLESGGGLTGGGITGPRPEAGPGATRPPRTPIQCGDLPFLIRRDGTWLYRGSPIQRKELVCLFSSVLRRDADGAWWLRTPAEHGRIEVEDAPFVAVELDWTGDGRRQILSLRTNTDQVVTAGPEHPIRVSHDLMTCEPTPYILLHKGDGPYAIEARINRAVYYELVALAVQEYVGPHLMLGVWSSGMFFPLGFMPGDADEDAL